MKSFPVRQTLVAYGLSAFVASAAPRVEVPLNGTWDAAVVSSLDDTPADAEWKAMPVPGLRDGDDYERAWLRRHFEVPAEWSGKRLLLHFGGVKYNSRVLVNGKAVGGCFNGYDPFTLDITEAVRFGAQNELRVGVHNWTGIFSDGKRIDFASAGNWLRKRDVPKDRVLAPMGGRYDRYGIWDDVSLLVVPTVYVRNIFLKPSVRTRQVEVEADIINAGRRPFAGTVSAEWFDWNGAPRDANGQWPVIGPGILSAKSSRVEIAPGKSASVTLNANAADLSPWWPNDPKLYVLELRCGEDAIRKRAGYREFDVRGPDFFINGIKTHLLATSWWPPREPLPRDDIARQMRAIKAMNAVCFRTHTQPWRRRWYETADEVGLLMIPEGAIWNDDNAYRVNDPVFWKHYADHLTAMVTELRNHPSVIMWSLENEFYGARAKDDTYAEERLADMGRVVKQTDSTRPITYESDGDPEGEADVIGIHYPNEIPERREWPNAAYWMDEPRAVHGGGGMFWDKRPFRWDRKKPLYIGEYLWVPARDPAPFTIFFGDIAYRDYERYRTLTKAMSWRMQIQAYRHYGVSGHSPWTVEEHGALDKSNPLWVAQRDLYRPLAAFIQEFDSRFFAGDTVIRTVEVFNDTIKDHAALLQWRLLDGSLLVSEGRQGVALVTGGQKTVRLRLKMPEADRVRHLTLALTLLSRGQAHFRETWPVTVFPRRTKWDMPSSPPALFDPDGMLARIWKAEGVVFTPIRSLESWDGEGVLVVGRRALDTLQTGASQVPVIGTQSKGRDVLAERIRAGGRVLLIEQSSRAGNALPARLTQQASTMAFPLSSDHPVTRGISAEDLRWWRGDNRVSVFEPVRPSFGALRPLVVTGTGQGLSHAPVLEIPDGRGTWLVCQLQVISKLQTEPMAGILLERMIRYLSLPASRTAPTVCVGSETLRQALGQIGVDCTPLASLSELQWPRAHVLILEGTADDLGPHAASLKTFIAAGGRVFWHRPDPEAVRLVTEALDCPVTMQPYPGSVERAEGTDPLLRAIAREDLAWLGPAKAVSWQRSDPATNVADGVLVFRQLPDGGETLEAEEDVETEGELVRATDSEVMFATQGSARWKIDLPRTGRYTLGLVASGTPVGGMYPLAEVRLDDERLGLVYVGAENFESYTLSFSARSGAHRLSVAFMNDRWDPPEDRNLHIDRLVVSPEQDDERVLAVTEPPALVRLRIGQGDLIINSMRWDDAGGNVRRAHRFVCSLLTALGARFRTTVNTTTIEAESMEPLTDMSWFRKESDHAAFADGGAIGTKVRIERAGRYRITAWAKGTPAAGEYPVVELTLGDVLLGTIHCASDDWAPHLLEAYLPEGEAELGVRFANDLYDPPEDRNLWLDRLEFEFLAEGDRTEDEER